MMIMPHLDVFTQLSLIFVMATVVALIMRLFRQPLLLGYIITGIIIGPSFLHLIQQRDAFDTFSELGITLLLFIIGLELSITVVKRLGKPVFITAAALLITIGTIGYLISTAFHFNETEAILVGLALFFSSTIIIAKTLSDKKELSRLNGQLAIGVILLDDMVATFALLFIAAHSGGAVGSSNIWLLIAKGVAIVIVLVILGMKVLPWFLKRIARSQELLFVFAIAWGFGVAALVNALGFSVEIGALFAGVTIAHLPYAPQIAAKLKPLRDFFIILFFISLGDSLSFASLSNAVLPALIFSAVVLFIKPLIVMITLGFLGYTKHTSFKTGINLSQVSEFSIIMIVLAQSAGLVSKDISAMVTLVALVTILVSTYFMKYDDWIYARVERYLHLFESRTIKEGPSAKTMIYPLVLFGYQNGGHQFIKTFHDMKLPFVVVDYDPEAIEELEHRHIDYLYGDATDPELLAELDIEKASLIVNTIGDHTVNIALIRYVRRRNEDAVVICYSSDHNHAAELYELGATYVFLPHFIGSEQLSSFIHEYGLDKRNFETVREHHLQEIREHLAAKDDPETEVVEGL